jgi:hypothetical protein
MMRGPGRSGAQPGPRVLLLGASLLIELDPQKAPRSAENGSSAESHRAIVCNPRMQSPR